MKSKFFWMTGLCGLLLIILACGGNSATATNLPTSTQAASPNPTSTPTNKPDSQPTARATAASTPLGVESTLAATSTPSSTPVSAPPIDFQVASLFEGDVILSGDDVVEITVGSPGFAVVGFARPSAVVSVNETIITVDESGMFTHFLPLTEGPNFAEVVVSDLLANQQAMLLVVYSIPDSEGPPLHVMWPPDELDVTVGRVSVIGTTRLDAVVSVNGTTVNVNVESGFQQEIVLQEGPNLIEVTASDIVGNSRTVQRVVTWVE